MAMFAMSAVAASSASAAKNGPHWWWGNKERTLKTEKLPITFKSGVTKLKVAGLSVECKKDKGTGELIGGWPGTDKATIMFEECTVETIGCKAKNKGGVFGTIEVKVNTELVYFTKKAGEEEKPPLGVLFKTTESSNKTFVELEFEGICALDNGPVTATGEATPAAEIPERIAGVAGVVCKIVEPAEKEALTHELECIEKEQTKFWFWKAGALTEGKAGLEFKGKPAEQVGKATIEAKETFDARGT